MKVKKLFLGLLSVFCFCFSVKTLTACKINTDRNFEEVFPTSPFESFDDESFDDESFDDESFDDDSSSVDNSDSNISSEEKQDENEYTEGLEFWLSSDETSYVVRRYSGFSTNVVIPSIYDNLPVTSIGDYAFWDCSSLTSITIPDSVTSIGQSAFDECSSLTSITIPDSVASIGDYSFLDCSSLTSITIPDSVKSFGKHVFEGCSSLTSVTIGNGVTSIGNSTFSGCSSLTHIAIGNGLTYIGYNAFKGCNSLTNIVVEEGNRCFDSRNNCNAIIETGDNILVLGCKNTIIPDSVRSIGDDAFLDCSSLTSITIPNSVKNLSCDSFEKCNSLTNIVVEEGNRYFDSRNNCNAIILTSTNTLLVGCKNTTIPNSVTSIGGYAFDGCSSLTSIIIPDSVTSIGMNAFYECSKLKTVYYTGTEEQWKNIYIESENYELANATIVYNYKG